MATIHGRASRSPRITAKRTAGRLWTYVLASQRMSRYSGPRPTMRSGEGSSRHSKGGGRGPQLPERQLRLHAKRARGLDREKVDLLIAIFIHRQSPSQDPQVHAHCIVMKIAIRHSDGEYSTIDAGPLLATRKLGGAVFRSALARELGIPVEPGRIRVSRAGGSRGPLRVLVEPGPRD